MSQWFISRQGKLQGPYTLPQLQQMVKAAQLQPTEILCPEGGAPTRAQRVLGLFEAPAPVVPAAPAAPTPVQATRKSEPVVTVPAPIPAPPPPAPAPVRIERVGPAAAPVPQPAAPNAPLPIPKPVLFAICGAVGGLVAALVIGELAWFLAKPPEATGQPGVRIAASKSMDCYPGSKQRCNVKLARDHWTGPVQVQLKDAPPGVSAAPAIAITKEAEEDVQVEVAVDATVPVGRHALTLIAQPADDSRLQPAEVPLELVVVAPPPSVGVSVSPSVVMDQGGERSFVVRVARGGFAAPVKLEFSDGPAGVSFSPTEVPAGKDEINVAARAVAGSDMGKNPVTVQARGTDKGSSASAAAAFDLEVRPQPRVDVVFVLDLTASMGAWITGIRNGIRDFAGKLESRNIDVRVGLVGFRDIEDQYYIDPKFGYPHGEPFALRFQGGVVLTKDYASFAEKLGAQKAEGGADRTNDESSLQALDYASRMPFRGDAARVLILVTDSGPRIHKKDDRYFRNGAYRVEREPYSIAQTIDMLKAKGIAQLHLVVMPDDYDGTSFAKSGGKWGSPENPYKDFHKAFKGKYYAIDKIARENSFDRMLPELSEQIGAVSAPAPPSVGAPPPIEAASSVAGLPPAPPAGGLPSAVSTVAYSAEDRLRLIAAIALWSTIMAAGISLLISLGQEIYLRKSLSQPLLWAKALAGGIVAGLIGGAIGQGFVQATAGGAVWEIVSRVIGWGLLGSLIGIGLSFVVPNLKWRRGLVGGLVGGVAGAVAFLIISFSLRVFLGGFGEAIGRLAGAAALGFFIGLMVALAEILRRSRWLEITFGAREVRTVTLGTAAVTLGSDPRASVVIQGAPALALRYRVEGERVLCEDMTSGATEEVPPGDKRRLAGVSIAVCSSTTVRASGFTLRLGDGTATVLGVGQPLTVEDVPGLQPQGTDGAVALVSPRPNDPRILLLRNRSKQTWQCKDRAGQATAVEPGRGVELSAGLQIDFGPVRGIVLESTSERGG